MRSMNSRAALLLVLSLSPLGRAQSPAAMKVVAGQPPPASTPTTGNTTNPSLSFDLVAIDKAGAPVSGLKPEDVTILDNGHPQAIASLRANGDSSEPTVEVVLLIDAINTGKETMDEEYDWLHTFLARSGKQLALPTSFAILQDKAVTMQNHPTRDTATLARFLDSNRPGFRALRTSSGGWGTIEREQICLSELNSLATQSEKKPGRKLFVWIGPGWGEGPDPARHPIGDKTEQRLFNAIIAEWDLLRQARVTLDMIDPTIAGDSLFNFNYKPYVKAVVQAHEAVYGDLMLPAIAAQTGGQVLYGTTNLPDLIDRCLADAQSFYVVTYTPPQAQHPAEFHSLEIKIDKPGVVARARTGYYAQP